METSITVMHFSQANSFCLLMTIQIIVNQVNSFRFKQVTENRERLKPIIETLILCGKQNIPLRGHRDDGELLNSNQQTLKNDGNFREILRYRVQSRDMILKKHLESSSSRDELKSLIVDQIKKVGIYAIILDETTDMSHTEQLSLSLRYVYDEKIYERFILFVDAYYKCINDNDIVSGELKLTGRAIGHIVLDILEKLGLGSKLCVGIGTDGCSVMTSNDIGAVTTVLETCSMAVRCPCFNHALNISLFQSSKVVSIRNTFCQATSCFKKYFETQFKRVMLLLLICLHLFQIVESLVEIQSWIDKTSSSKALSLVSTICTSEFLISLYSLIDVLKHSLVVSRFLQSDSLDLQNATQATQKEKRNSCNQEFKHIFSEAQKILTELGFEIKLPRLVKTMNHRANYPTEGEGNEAI
ncbi:52 kDa repressor of the inhibitor of the protein kinase-like [Aphis craccivora]|uniref:52 kDa repressor of the inhibitor of the protein kinase-like n=1 Tax=Aphis craccivora TaxID=307492 RepID=A0A6G0WEQ5_APHCR|nr:52 kDa repressor of the inhibitor of the protein kinase-like [Aphis craccivora]